MRMKKYLFVCTGNTCRSPMAEAILKKILKSDEVRSAGLNAFPGIPTSHKTVEVLKEIEIEFEGRSRRLNDELVEWADLIICMENWQKEEAMSRFTNSNEKILTIGEWCGKKYLEIGDPVGEDIEGYRIVRDKLLDAIKLGIAQLNF